MFNLIAQGLFTSRLHQIIGILWIARKAQRKAPQAWHEGDKVALKSRSQSRCHGFLRSMANNAHLAQSIPAACLFFCTICVVLHKDRSDRWLVGPMNTKTGRRVHPNSSRQLTSL